jgi:hypothetical protein
MASAKTLFLLGASSLSSLAAASQYGYQEPMSGAFDEAACPDYTTYSTYRQ